MQQSQWLNRLLIMKNELLVLVNDRLVALRKRYKDQPNVGTMGRIKELLWIRTQLTWMIKHEQHR